MANKRKYFTREKYIYFFLIIMGIMIFSKLFWLQVIKADELRIIGERTINTLGNTTLPERGIIYDAQGNVLAKNIIAKDVYFDLEPLNDYLDNNQDGWTRKTFLKEMEQLLAKDEQEIKEILATGNLISVCAAHQLAYEKVKVIDELNIPGIRFEDTFKRVYPMGDSAASVLGIVNMSGHGVEGLEAYYDQELLGILDTQTIITQISKGYNLRLTLDSTIQHLLEQELNAIMEESHPQQAVIVAMEPSTGKILAMGSRPTFDPNNYLNSTPEQRKNLAISMIYEPGSTFKIVTGAAALEENIVKPGTEFYDPGYLRIGGRTITNWDSDKKPHGYIPFSDGMRLSSNVVLAQVGIKMGKELFFTYLNSFGFGKRTGVDLAGEERGLLIDKTNVRKLELATMSFGQANLVTPIQLLNSICAVANGGTLYQPYIVDQIVSSTGEVVADHKPQEKRKVLSKATSEAMTEILVNVVDNGTGSMAKIPGIKVAGKTGTAQKIDPETGKYSEVDFVASFVAYAPADDPKIAVLAALDSPQGDIVQGGTMAGPHARKIIEGTLQYYGLPVASGTSNQFLDNSQDETSIEEEKDTDEDETITPQREPGQDEVVVPDLRGYTIREAGKILGNLDLHYNFAGSGLAKKQNPLPGSIVNKGDYVEVVFSPQVSE